MKCDDQSYTKLMTLLSVIVSTLMKRSVTASNIHSAKLLVRRFQELAVDLFGPSIQSMTLHCLSHLPDQVKQFGALFSVSATIFENSYRHLKKLVTGTKNEGELIVKRFLIHYDLGLSKKRRT